MKGFESIAIYFISGFVCFTRPFVKSPIRLRKITIDYDYTFYYLISMQSLLIFFVDLGARYTVIYYLFFFIGSIIIPKYVSSLIAFYLLYGYDDLWMRNMLFYAGNNVTTVSSLYILCIISRVPPYTYLLKKWNGSYFWRNFFFWDSVCRTFYSFLFMGFLVYIDCV